MKNVRGYTLTEMVVTLSIFSMLIVAAGSLFDSLQESLDGNYHQLVLQKELRRVLDIMSEEIRESSPSSPNPIVTSSNTVTFQIPASISGNLITSWTQISYSLGQNNTVVRNVNGQNDVIGTSVTSLNFVYPLNPVTDPRTVRIQITGQRNTLKRTITASVTGQVILRNP